MGSLYVPMFHNTHGRLCAPDNLANTCGANFPYRANSSIFRVSAIDGGTQPPYLVTRQGADDTQFGFFLGVPPLQPYAGATPQ